MFVEIVDQPQTELKLPQHSDGLLSGSSISWPKVGFRGTCYHLATPAVAEMARTEEIYKTERFSDHAPITVEYALQVG